MRPLGFEGSRRTAEPDGEFAGARLLAPGVYIVIHGQVFPVDRAMKRSGAGNVRRQKPGGRWVSLMRRGTVQMSVLLARFLRPFAMRIASNESPESEYDGTVAS